MSKYIYFFIVMFFLLTSQVWAAEGVGQQMYQWEGCPDPFLPFLSPADQPPLLRPDGIPFEPGQLKQAAEDISGKGYVLREGTPVGKYGVVRKIESGQVVIDESFTTKSGRIVAKNTVMRLKQEGEK